MTKIYRKGTLVEHLRCARGHRESRSRLVYDLVGQGSIRQVRMTIVSPGKFTEMSLPMYFLYDGLRLSKTVDD